MMDFDSYMYIYLYGLQYTIIGGIILSFCFALGRWVYCIKKYIKTGNIDRVDGSYFLGENNWFHGNHSIMNYYNNPWVIALDIASVSICTALLAIIWPISIIVFSAITYAKVARVRVKRKKEFIDRLAGEHT